MDPILSAIEAIELREDSASFLYCEVANKFNVDRMTLLWCYLGVRGSNEVMGKAQQLLSPQQELELVQYIERCKRQGLLSTREMVQNFSSAVAKWEVLQSWVTQFLHRHACKLITKWSAGINRDRHKADNSDKYNLYFNLLHEKMQEYGINKRNMYNMDEKSFFIGRTTRLKESLVRLLWLKKSIPERSRMATGNG
jgi:hypothetical protein